MNEQSSSDCATVETIKSKFDESRIYYVYAWYYVDSGEIFYIGKGKNNRYKERKAHRNQYFINILQKHGDGVSVKFLHENLTEKEAFDLERKLIAEHWAMGLCKANLHEGGCGGYTGNYDSPERNRKIREANIKRDYRGKRNPMYGVHLKMSDETKRKLSEIFTGRKLSQETIEKIRERLSGRKMSESHYRKMMYTKCDLVFIVHYKEQLSYICLGTHHIENFFIDKLNTSQVVLHKMLSGNYHPKFGRMKFLEDIKVEQIKIELASKWIAMLDGNVDKLFLEPPIKSTHRRIDTGVIKCDGNGVELARYQSLKDAARDSGCNVANICKACRGVYTQTGGFRWRYIDADVQDK